MNRPRRPLVIDFSRSDLPGHSYASPSTVCRGWVCECGQRWRRLTTWQHHVLGAAGATEPPLQPGDQIRWRAAGVWHVGRFVNYHGFHLVVELPDGTIVVRPPRGHQRTNPTNPTLERTPR